MHVLQNKDFYSKGIHCWKRVQQIRMKHRAAWHKSGGKLRNSAQLQDTTINTVCLSIEPNSKTPLCKRSHYRETLGTLSAPSVALLFWFSPTVQFVTTGCSLLIIAKWPRGTGSCPSRFNDCVSVRPKACLLPRNKIDALACWSQLNGSCHLIHCGHTCCRCSQLYTHYYRMPLLILWFLIVLLLIRY